MNFRAQDNGRFASVGGDKYLYLWDVTTGKILRKFVGHNAVDLNISLNHRKLIPSLGMKIILF